MPLEEEIKLTAPSPDCLENLLTDASVRRHAQGRLPESHPFIATYYDTAQRTLLYHRLAFRLRRKGERWMAGLKGGGAVVNGLSRRMEWEIRLDGPIADFHQLPPGELYEQMRPLLPVPAPMLPLMTTQVERRTLRLSLENGCQVELALDQGWVQVENRKSPICEAELERIAGPMEPMTRFAAELAQTHALRPAGGSKFTQGLELLGLLPELSRQGIVL